MKNRKLFPGLYDDGQLRTMDAAIERVVTVMNEIGAINARSAERYRRFVAGLAVDIARAFAYDEDELTQRVLERLIKPDASNDDRIAPKNEPLRVAAARRAAR